MHKQIKTKTMKTVKNSKSMRAILVAIFAVSFTAAVNGQSFLTPNPDSPVIQSPSEDVRTGSSVDYSLDNGSHLAGEQYRWVVTGGEITAVNGTGVISGADNNIVEFADNAHTITVDWDEAPGTATGSVAGQIQVQKVSTDNCPSQVQTLDVAVWNLPTANITDADVTGFCSGDATAGTITVDLTGAPDDGTADGFSVSYEYVVGSGDGSITDGAAAEVNGQTGTETTNAGSLTIPLPASLVNLTGVDQTFTVNLTAMTDDFDDQNGTWTDGSYVITVHPVPVTGDIQSTVSLNRR